MNAVNVSILGLVFLLVRHFLSCLKAAARHVNSINLTNVNLSQEKPVNLKKQKGIDPKNNEKHTNIVKWWTINNILLDEQEEQRNKIEIYIS